MTTTSFLLTPELKTKLVNLAVSVNGKFEPFVNQVEVVEPDPSQCKFLILTPLLIKSLIPFPQSEITFRRTWTLQFYERLPHSSTSPSSNQG